MNEQQFQRVQLDDGFIAALDQSGGSSAKALALYGVAEEAYSSDAQMFDLIHDMRARIVTSPAFNGDRIVGAILFEDTINREINAQRSPSYLWATKQIVPFLKVDRGLISEVDGAHLMKPIHDLDALLERAKGVGIFGTKMRSVINLADDTGITAVIDQQFTVARQIMATGLVPIIEPEVVIHSPQKAEAEVLLKAAIVARLDHLASHQHVMLKLTLPEQDDLYAELAQHPNVLRLLALSGGYKRTEANVRLARNKHMIASFSRALTEGLSIQQDDEEFNGVLNRSIQSIFDASMKKSLAP